MALHPYTVQHLSPGNKAIFRFNKGLGWCCFNRVPQTRWFISNRNLFLTILEVRSLRSGCQPAWSGSGENPLFIWRRGQEGSFVRVLSRGLHLHDLITFPKAPSPNTIALGVKISTYEFGREIHSLLNNYHTINIYPQMNINT